MSVNPYYEGRLYYSDSTRTTVVSCDKYVDYVDVPNSVTTIGKGAFFRCTLPSLELPSSVTTICDSAFASCFSLYPLIVPNTVTSIGPRSFQDVRHVIYHGPLGDTTDWGQVSINGYQYGLYTYSDSTLTKVISCKPQVSSINIQPSVTSIGSLAFNNLGPRKLTLHEGIDSIGFGAFRHCDYLETVTFPSTLTYIGGQCFAYTSVKRFELPSSMTRLASSAFASCSVTEEIVLPASINYIGSGAFTYTFSLKRLIVHAPTPPTTVSNTFSGMRQTVNLMVPCGSLAAYQEASGWGSFPHISEIVSTHMTLADVPAMMGSAEVTDGPNCADSTVTVEATPNAGFRFVEWSDGSTQNPYTLHLVGDSTLTPLFGTDDTLIVRDTLEVHDTVEVLMPVTRYELSLKSYPEECGIAVGSGTFADSTVVEIVAIPVVGQHFVIWTDGCRENPRHLMVTEDMEMSAVFDPDPEGVTLVEPYPYTITCDRAVVTVRGAQGQRVRIFDSVGRLLVTTASAQEVHTYSMPASGTYLVQVADQPAQRVTVVK